MNDIMKIVLALEDSDILLKRITKTIQNKVKHQKGEFLEISLGTLGASLLENRLAGKGIVITRYNNKGHQILRARYGSKGSSIRMDF